MRGMSCDTMWRVCQADSKQWKEVGQGEVVLRIWEVESDHNYDNDMHITQVCPLLSSCTCFSAALRPLILLRRNIFVPCRVCVCAVMIRNVHVCQIEIFSGVMWPCFRWSHDSSCCRLMGRFCVRLDNIPVFLYLGWHLFLCHTLLTLVAPLFKHVVSCVKLKHYYTVLVSVIVVWLPGSIFIHCRVWQQMWNGKQVSWWYEH